MRNRKAIKGIVAALLAFCLLGASALVGCTANNGGGSNSGGSNSGGSQEEEVFGTITITIDITEAVEAEDPTALALVDERGGNTYTIEATIDEGDTALSATQNSELIVATSTASWGVMITSIDSLEGGSTSGWIFTINGESPDVGADQVEVADGDEIVWSYVFWTF